MTKHFLTALFTVVFMTAQGFMNPVNPTPLEMTPFPEEAQEAILSKSGSNVQGMASVTFHIDATGHVVVEGVNASTLGLENHIWKTVHGMETQDTTLVQGETYSVSFVVK